jgi:TFIIF-interacting CTD phosphatase-like protein
VLEDGSNFIKDLRNLGRDLKHLIIIDNSHVNFKYHTENAIFVKTWFSDAQDDELYYLKNMLKSIYIYIVINYKQLQYIFYRDSFE